MQTGKFRAAAAFFFWQLLGVLFDFVGLCQSYCIFELLDVGQHQVTLWPRLKISCISFVTIYFGTLTEVSLFSSFPRYGKLLNRYFVSASSAIQNLIPSLSGLFCMD